MPPLESAIPFIGVLLSITLCPLLVPRLWHKYENLVLALWVVLSVGLCLFAIGAASTTSIITNVMIKEYIPFVTLIGTLFTISNGINVQINRAGTTKVNLLLLTIGELLANFIGTTGTAILLLRPLLHANRHRKYTVHTVIFFIFLVSNIGGCLLPFGDPPLFLGYLKGIDFFWTAKHMLPFFLASSAILLAVYGAIDYFLMRKEDLGGSATELGVTQHRPVLKISGLFNIFLMFFIVILVAGTGLLPKKTVFTIFDVNIQYKNLVRDIGLLIIAAVSIMRERHKTGQAGQKHEISWGPLNEVIRYFIAIFITMAPVALMLKKGHEFFAPIRDMLSQSEHVAFLYFWFVSPFSALLDNAPTYLIFFKMAGGDAQILMHEGAKILTAISAGSVFMGAMTYIGNAPNFMIRSIAKQHGVAMPSFLGYMVWSSLILVPLFAALSYLFLY
jgi:Na+/H+ antiporter NhaD/arsenite permease-like protein